MLVCCSYVYVDVYVDVYLYALPTILYSVYIFQTHTVNIIIIIII